MINVGVTGALGKMGSEVVKTVINNNEQKGEMTLVMAVDKFRTGENVFNFNALVIRENLANYLIYFCKWH